MMSQEYKSVKTKNSQGEQVSKRNTNSNLQRTVNSQNLRVMERYVISTENLKFRSWKKEEFLENTPCLAGKDMYLTRSRSKRHKMKKIHRTAMVYFDIVCQSPPC